MEYVIPIEAATEETVLETGRKCVQLSNLLLAGFNVPKGFCITASGYDCFVAYNGLEERIRRFLSEAAPRAGAGAERPGAKNPELLECFKQARFPAQLREQIVRAYRRLGATQGRRSQRRVAVRSSGLVEDGLQASFAGQFETCLNIRGEEELLEQIKHCWSSFWQCHSICYQKDRLGSDNHELNRIALLVQEMIPATTAGVLFTRHPIEGHPDEMIIEAGWGLGEAIVSGIVKPDHFVVDTASLEITHCEIRQKDVQVVMDTRAGALTRQVPVPLKKRTVPCLTESEVRLLCATSKKIQELWGIPQDIEWAFYRKKLFILQARPITTLPAQGQGAVLTAPASAPSGGAFSEFDTPTDPSTEWTSATITEMLPGVLSPLTLSLMPALEYGFQKPIMDLGMLRHVPSKDAVSFLGFFYNRAYLNLTLVRSLIRQVPLISPETMERILGSEDGDARQERPPRFVRDLPHMLRIGYHALHLAQRLKPAAEALIETGMRQYAEGRLWDIPAMETLEILSLIQTIQRATADIYALHITASEFGELTFQLIKKLTGRWAKDEYGVLASQLITGSYNPHVGRPLYDIWGLAQKVRDSQRLQRVFALPSSEKILSALESETSRAATAFMAEFQRFLERYGYRSRYGAELMHPRWEEEADFIVSLIKIYTRTLLKVNPWEIKRGQLQRRAVASQKIESRLNPVQKRIVRRLAQLMLDVFIPLRQNMRALSLMNAHLARRLAQELGRRFCSKGLIGQAEDIYFLTIGEIMALGGSRAEELPETLLRVSSPAPSVEELRRSIERRRFEYRRNLSLALPEHCRGRPVPVCGQERRARLAGEKRLRGFPASPGRCTGTARLVTIHSRAVSIKQGDILVIPGMDAGWTPLFLSAAAIVAERGGVLSHGSLAAREYGLPAVSNVRLATHLIKDGQVITVDGDRGEVWL